MDRAARASRPACARVGVVIRSTEATSTPSAHEVLRDAPHQRRLAIAARREDDDVLAVADVGPQLGDLLLAIGEGIVERQRAVAKGIRVRVHGNTVTDDDTYLEQHYCALGKIVIERMRRGRGWPRGLHRLAQHFMQTGALAGVEVAEQLGLDAPRKRIGPRPAGAGPGRDAHHGAAAVDLVARALGQAVGARDRRRRPRPAPGSRPHSPASTSLGRRLVGARARPASSTARPLRPDPQRAGRSARRSHLVAELVHQQCRAIREAPGATVCVRARCHDGHDIRVNDL